MPPYRRRRTGNYSAAIAAPASALLGRDLAVDHGARGDTAGVLVGFDRRPVVPVFLLQVEDLPVLVEGLPDLLVLHLDEIGLDRLAGDLVGVGPEIVRRGLGLRR